MTPPVLRLGAVLLWTGAASVAAPLISEIYYHPPHPAGAEDPRGEWIEIHNPETDTPFDLSGWRFSAGVDFTFPEGASLPAGGYLVVAADPATFVANHAGAPAPLGPWGGRLSNSGETIRLRDAAGVEIDQVDYADEGAWATRVRGPLDRGHEGWVWEASHDGGGTSLELVNPALPNNIGQNWRSSAAAGGSPGAANGVAPDAVTVLVADLSHSPLVPHASETVTVAVEVRATSPPAALSVDLFWRLDGAVDFVQVPMGHDGDDRFAAAIPPQPDGAIVEFYVRAADGANSHAWPAEVGGGGHEANALYQVDDGFDPEIVCAPGAQPVYYVIMTEAERAELEEIGTTSSQAESNAEFNCTFISLESASTRVRYLASIRNRGASSRRGPPNNHLVKFRSDAAWEGLASIKFNCQFVHSQVAGSWLYQWLGIEAADSIPVQLRINGTDLAQPGGPRMFGSYARTESLDGEFAAAHFPNDPDGNLYQVRDDEDTGDEGDLRYEGADPAAYQNTYFKQTNASEDDWSDLIALTDALNNAPAATYLEDVSAVLDVGQWVRFLAVDGLVGNREGGLNTQKGDDYALYRGKLDTRFKLVPHDLDTVLDQGTRTGGEDLSLFTYAGVDGLEEFLGHPDIIPLYYRACLELVESKYRSELISPIIDRAVGGFVPAGTVQEMKDFVGARRAGVLAQIPTTYSAGHDLATTPEGYGRTDSGAASLAGSFHAAYTRSVMVNGRPAELDARAGTWSLDTPAGGGGVLAPGLNRVVVTFHEAKNGAGAILHREALDIWYDGGAVNPVSGTLTGDAALGTLALTTRDTYLPGVPFLVRVDFRNPDGSFARDLWETTATLTTDAPGVLLSPNTIAVRNGLGTALVTAGGGGAAVPVTVLPAGSTWNYLDDGSDQGIAWRAVGFDDSAWASGPAQLGYGDGDEQTVVGFGPSSSDKYATTYFRTSFEVEDASVVTSVDMRIRYDDGAAVYVNGTEFWRSSNMAPDMPFDAYTVGGEDTPSENFQTFNGLPPSLFATGANTIAVEVKQGDGGSSDLSFDLELVTQTAGAGGGDPGEFVITASSNGQNASKAMASLTAAPPISNVSGTLAGATTEWSGVVRVTDDLTVPAGHTLNIAPGTLVLVDGDATPESTAGKDIVVEGTINSLGTAAQPVTFTATVPDNIWGEIRFAQCEGASFTYTNIHRAGHSPRGGHTGHGRVLRILGSAVSFEDCNITDNRGKIGESDDDGGSDSSMTFRRCHWARSVMGMETWNTGVLVEDGWITDMLGIYREDGVTDDNDAIYLHAAGAGQTIELHRVVLAYCDDDGIDTLGSTVVATACISRDMFDKGVSVNGGSTSLIRCILAGNDIGANSKNGGQLAVDHCTVAANTTVGLNAENESSAGNIAVSNSVAAGADPIGEDVPGSVVASYSVIDEPWAGTGVVDADPMLADVANGNFRLAPGSPAIDAGDPGAPPDPDGSRADAGAFAFVPASGSEVRWAPDGGPYHVTGDVTIPVGTVFVIEPGTSVYFDEDTQITINGVAQIVGTPTRRIVFSPVPGAPYVPDPAGNGSLPDGPPKSDGIKIVDSMDPANRIAHIDIGHAQDSNGSIGIIRSQCVVDDVRFYGSKIRMFYTEDASIILENCLFPDVFEPDEQADALGLDNVSEQVKGVGEPPAGGRYIIRNNTFGITKGHNDVVDVDSGRRPDPIVQVIGNTFTNAGDEHLDLGGDVYVAGNLFRNIFKDDETSDRGYANAISTGDAGSGTTIVVARNVFWDVDHCINLKVNTASIFEHNSVYKVHPDFVDVHGNPSVASVVNLFIPTDTDPGAFAGDGAYLAGNILAEVPRIFSGVDDDKPGRPTPSTPLEMFDNLIDPDISDLSISPERPGETVLDLGANNVLAEAMYRDPDNGDFALSPSSPAVGANRFGGDLGAMVAEGIFITGEPPALTTSADATLTVGGPGIFAFRWRLNEGAWSDVTPIGSGFDPPEPTVRDAQIELTGLAEGEYYVEVEGQNFAGGWQPVPTVSKTWGVAASIPASVRINEVSAAGDWVELHNPGQSAIDITGFTLGDGPDLPLTLSGTIDAGGYRVVSNLTFGIDRDGETLTLAQDGAEVDAVTFGLGFEGATVGRAGHGSAWTLCVPTPGGPNQAQRLGDPGGVRISEWLANAQVRTAGEFVELHNPGTLPVEVSGMALTDNPNGDPSAMVFPPLSFIGAGGYTAVRPDGFGLSAELDQIALFASSGSLLDQVVYGPQAEDYSEGPGGGGEFEQWRLPSPGIPTPDPADPGYLNALALIDGLRISEIMFNPPGGREYEFIELRNVGGVPLELDGVRFTDGIGFVFPAMVLAPGEEVVLVDNPGAMAARYPGISIAGEYSGNLSNGGERLTLMLPEPFDVAILRFEFDDRWVTAADGEGASLDLLDPAAKAKRWGEASLWGESPFLGSPGGLEVLENYAGWAAANGVGGGGEDPDGDGVANALEYKLDTDPNVPGALPGVIANGDQVEWVLSTKLARSDVSLAFQTSADLEGWEGEPAFTSAVNDQLIYSVILPLDGAARRFVRALALQVD